MKYPGAVGFKDFTGGVDKKPNPLVDGFDAGSNDKPASGVVACKQTWGVEEVTLAASGRKSQSQSKRDHDALDGGKDAEGRIQIAPTLDAVTVSWKLKKPELAQTVHLQLFRCGSRTPIWKRTLDGDGARKLGFSGTWDGTFPKSEWIDTAHFPSGMLNAGHSPYMFKISADGGDVEEGFVERWTYIDVIVHEIKLHWGSDAMISDKRPDIKKKVIGRAPAELVRELVKREKDLFARTITKLPSEDQTLLLPCGVYEYDKYHQPTDERKYYEDMWADGPRIPLAVSATIRTASGEGADVPKALFGTRFLWDWRDNVDEPLEDRLNTWTGKADASPDKRTTLITRKFLEETFKKHSYENFPGHAYNAPEIFGGKRSLDPQNARVFPSYDADLPNHVSPAINRKWASISEISDEGIKAIDGKVVQSGIIFQPAAIAGDTYFLSVFVASGIPEGIDYAERDGAFFEPNKITDLPFAQTGKISIQRHMKGSYYASPSFYEGIDITISAIQERLRTQLGFEVDISKQKFPDFQHDLREAILQEVKEVNDHQTQGKSLILWTAVDNSGVAKDNDYAFQLWNSAERHEENIKHYIRTCPIHLIESVDSELGLTSGRLLQGVDSNALGVSLPLTYQSKVSPLYNYYSGRGYELILNLSNTDFQDERVEVIGSGATTPISVIGDGPSIFDDAEVKSVAPDWASPKSKHVRLRHPAIEEVVLNFGQKIGRPTRQLDPSHEKQIDEFIQNLGASGQHGKVTIEVLGKTADSRELTRVTNVVDYMQRRIIHREKLVEIFFHQVIGQMGIETYDRYTIGPAWRRVLNNSMLTYAKQANENKGWEEEGRSIFWQLRGRTQLDAKFTTGGIENNYCEEKMGLAQLMVPAVNAEDQVEKRLLKDPIVVAIHEFGHSLMLKHSQPRFFDSKVAPGVNEHHLAHDACIMNYDADTVSFCAICMLRKRGWDITATRLTDKHGNGNDAEWSRQSYELLLKETTQAPGSALPRVRLAMFCLEAEKLLGDSVSRIDEAKALMKRAEELATAGQTVWFLRNAAVFHYLVAKKADEDPTAEDSDYNAYCLKLKAQSDFPIDIDVIKSDVAANLGLWVAS